jgi:hypothetical protein
MDMKILLMILAFTLPLMAQEVEVKEVDGKTEVTVKKHRDDGDMRAWKQRGDMKRSGMDQRKKRMAMAEKRKMHKKRAIRSFVRIVVIGGVASYIGYTRGERSHKGGWDRKPPMGDRK